MNKFTKPTKIKDVTRTWHLIDVDNKVLGRISTQIAHLLMGKAKPNFVRNEDLGDHVVVINAKSVVTTGKKESKKKYYHHSGYPHGFKVTTLAVLRQTKPEKIIFHAVRGMLPQNKLRDRMLKRLFVFPEEKHPYGEKINPD